MPLPKIELDLADLGLPTGYDHEGEPTGNQTLQDMIIDAAVKALLDTDNMRSTVREQVERKVSLLVDEKVEALVTEAFAAPIQRTTRWGEPQGEPTSVLEIIRESVERYVTAPKSDGYRNPRNLQELIDDATKRLLEKDFTDYLKQVKEGVKVTVHQRALDQAVAFLQK